MRIYVAEVTGVAIVSGAPVTTIFRYSTSGYATWPTDNPANVYFEERIVEPASISRSLFAPSRISGRSTIGYGGLKLVNLDGGLDSIFLGSNPYAFDGHPIKIYTGDDKNAFNTFTLLFAGTVETAIIDLNEVTFSLKDKTYNFDKFLQGSKYGGTNVLPSGVDGTASDLKDKVKPLAYGKPLNTTPILVNTTKLIYQVNDGAIASVVVYDKGVALTQGAVYTSLADMEATAPSAGTYRALPGTGHFRLGSTPAGVLTCDLVVGSTVNSNRISGIFQSVVSKAIPSLTFVSSDLTALDSEVPYDLGLYISEPINTLEVLDQLVDSVGAWYTFSLDGTQVRIGTLKVPTAPEVTTIDDTNIISIELITPNDDTKGAAVASVKLRHSKNWTVQDRSQLAASVTEVRITRLGTEYLETEVTGGASLVQYPLAPSLQKDTLLVDATQVTTEATRQRDLHKVKRHMFSMSVRGLPVTLALNDVIKLVFPRFNLAAGKLFRVISIENNYNIDGINLVVWG